MSVCVSRGCVTFCIADCEDVCVTSIYWYSDYVVHMDCEDTCYLYSCILI